MTNSERVYKEIGIVTTEFKSESHRDKRKNQFAIFDSLAEYFYSMEQGRKIGFKKFGGNGNEWTFGSEFKTYELTSHAMVNGLCSNKTLGRLSEYENALMDHSEVKELVHRSTTKKKHRIFSEDGSELCIDRLMSGDQNYWSKTTYGRKNNVIRLGVNMCVSANMNEATINKMAAFSIAACNIIELSGYSVEFYMCIIGANSTASVNYGGARIKLKGADEKVDVQRISCLGLPGVFRHFGHELQMNILDDGYGSGYSCIGSTDEVNKHLGIDFLIDNHYVENVNEFVINLQNLIK